MLLPIQGENVADSIEIAKGQFRTNYRQTTYDMSEETTSLPMLP